MMTLDLARMHVGIVICSSHLPGQKEHREAWAIIDAHIAQQPDLAAIREVIAKWKSEVAATKRRAQEYGIAPVNVGTETLACISELERAIGDKP